MMNKKITLIHNSINIGNGKSGKYFQDQLDTINGVLKDQIPNIEISYSYYKDIVEGSHHDLQIWIITCEAVDKEKFPLS